VLEFVRNEKHILNVIHGASVTECIMNCKNDRNSACVAVGYKTSGLFWNEKQEPCYLFSTLDFRIEGGETVKMVSYILYRIKQCWTSFSSP